MTTRLITTIAETKAALRETRSRGRSVALVPTMGALHEGHLNLVRQANQQCDVVVVSIFVNPTQFGPTEDLARYPRNLTNDLELLRSFNVDVVFAPGDAEMFPDSFGTFVEPGETSSRFEGAARPGHFRGVATVVLKLFNIVQPDVAYFGQKDFQQVQVIRRLVEDFNLDTRLVVCSIVREPDGLALSSRNAYLSAEDRHAATVLSRSLRRGEELVQAGETDAEKILEEMRRVLASEPRAQTEYIAIVEPTWLRPVERVTVGSVALVAARVGPVRLIDNLVFGPPGSSPELLIQLALAARPLLDSRARIPGLQVESLRLKIENCRDCAAVSSIQLPPREFLVRYVKRDYPDLNAVRILVIGRDAPMNPDNSLYQNPEGTSRFVAGLFELLGVKNFHEFKQRHALTDAARCHCTGTRVPEKALAYCSKHLRDELKLFPNLGAIVILGEEPYLQIQKLLLGREAETIKSFEELLGEKGWAEESVHLPEFGERTVRIFYCYHPTYGYKRSPSIAGALA